MTLTYEENTKDVALETYEWDDIWYDHVPDNTKPRILLVGDSISRGYRFNVINNLNDEYHTDAWATSKAVDNPAFIKQLDLVLSQADGYKLIHINNGLHGWHLSTAEYKKHYEEIICHILKNYPDKKLIIALTTPVRDKETKELCTERNTLAIERNQAAIELAEKYSLPVTDLYNSPALQREDLYRDVVHQTEEGYEILGKIVSDKIKEALCK